MSITKLTAIQFAQKEELPPISKDIGAVQPPPLTFDPDKDQAWVVGPQIFSFIKGVTAERREMIANSALFASLVADATGKQRESEAWYTTYTNALTRLGWVLQDSTNRHYDQEHKGSTVHEAVLEFVAVLGVGGTALGIVTAALKAMQKVGDNKPWITLFDRQTNSENLTGFQVGLVSQDANADFQIKLMSFTLKLTQINTQILFIKFDTFGVHMDARGSSVTVSDEILREALPALKARLKSYVSSYVSEVELPLLA